MQDIYVVVLKVKLTEISAANRPPYDIFSPLQDLYSDALYIVQLYRDKK